MRIGNLGVQTNDNIICPFCDCDFVHPESLRVYPVRGNTECKISSHGISVGKSEEVVGQRGISIVLRFWCEEGHIWDSQLLFHKGVTEVRTQLVREFEGPHFPETLWRR